MSRWLRGGALTALSRIVTQGAQLVTFLVAAASMSPADFGIFALVSAAVVIMTTLSGSGWPEYTMQWTGPIQQLRYVFALSLFSAAVMACICFVVAQALPLFTDVAQAGSLMELFALTILLYGAANTLNAVEIWQHRLSTAALVIMAAEVLGMVAAVVMLRHGYGIYALAWGKIITTSVWLSLGLFQTRLLPDFRVPRAVSAEIVHFALHIISVRMMITTRAYSGTILVGWFLGAADAGLFRAAQRLSGAIAEIIGEPTRVLAWSLFRQTRDSAAGISGFQDRANSLLPLVSAISLPCFATLAIWGSDLAVGLLGESWAAAGPVLTALALMNIIFIFSAANEPILSLAGEVRAMPRMVMENLVTGIVLTLCAGPFGLLPIAWAQVVAAIIIVARNSRILKSEARVELLQVLRAARWQIPCIVISISIAQVSAHYILPTVIGPLLRFISIGVMNVLVFTALLLIVDSNLRLSLKLITRRR